MSSAGFLTAYPDVSRETIDRLSAYEALLKKWNPAINLVSARSLDEVWSRHFLDSAQLFELGPENAKLWVDIGSGGGFPGLVIAVLAKQFRPEMRVILVESDARKSAFLATVARNLDLPVQVIAQRIEAADLPTADILSARALAPLDLLLAFADQILAPTGVAIFPKGERWRDELIAAQGLWSFEHEAHISKTDPAAAILKIKGLMSV